MLHGKPEAKAVLTNYLQQLRTNPNPGPIGARLAAVYPSLNDSLNKHLAELETSQPATHAQTTLRIQ
jgi:hypothetical protein